MTAAISDFNDRVRVLINQQGVVVTEPELSRLASRYPECGGTDLWDVRAYVRSVGLGAREYHVVRGSSVVDVYRSTERDNAAAVRSALNDLELQRKDDGGNA
ncbi:MAG TPA: hypothetical protein VMH88_14075 [Gemmatimonadales bacterium]|nr:hypothetical protein [Gemmatimonadales bacterium]